MAIFGRKRSEINKTQDFWLEFPWAWGGDLIVFVGPGVGHLNDPDLPREGIFESVFAGRVLGSIEPFNILQYQIKWKLYFQNRKLSSGWKSVILLQINTCGESWDLSSEKSWVPVPNQWVPVEKKKSPKLKMLGLLCNQTVNLKKTWKLGVKLYWNYFRAQQRLK